METDTQGSNLVRPHLNAPELHLVKHQGDRKGVAVGCQMYQMLP